MNLFNSPTLNNLTKGNKSNRCIFCNSCFFVIQNQPTLQAYKHKDAPARKLTADL